MEDIDVTTATGETLTDAVHKDEIIGGIPFPLGLIANDMEDPQTMFAVATAVVAVVAVVVWKTMFTNRGPKKFLPVDDFIAVPLQKKEVLSHDTVRFTFTLPDPQACLGLPIGQHLTLKFYDSTDNGKAIQRSYTPVTDDRAIGYFSLVVKVYKPLEPKFPKGGLMSQHLNDLRIGEIIQIKGPKGHMEYLENGNFTVKPLGKPRETRSCTNIGMMAGGTGITPMLQFLQNIFDHPRTAPRNKNVRVKLIYANQTPDDILVRTELEDLAERFPDRFQLHYTVDRVECKDVANGNGKNEDWKYSTGFISTEMVQKYCTFESGKTQYFMCGPPPMLKFACIPALQALGFNEKDWVTM